MVGCWVIWNERCECIFRDKTLHSTNTVSRFNFHINNFHMSLNPIEPTIDIVIVMDNNTRDFSLVRLHVDVSFD